jgi:hypothetical protein
MRYRNTAGEIEARDSASRRTLTAEERKKTPPKYGDGNNVRGNRYNTHLIVTPDGKVFKFSEKIKDTTREPSQGVTFSGSLAETTSVASKDNIRQSEKKVKQNFSIDDQAYLDAAESGDMETAQRMVCYGSG